MDNERYFKSLEILTYYQLHRYDHISINQIACQVSVSWKRIRDVFNRFKETGDIKEKERSGRPLEITDRTKRAILNHIDKNRKTTLVKIKHDLQLDISKSSIHNILKDEGLSSHYAKKKFSIPEKAKINRLNVAKKWQKFKASFWNRIIWSDECNVVFGGPNDKIRIWKYHDEFVFPNQNDTAEKFGKFSIGVWACFLANGTRSIEFYDGRLDAISYSKILEKNLIPIIKAKRGKYRPIFQQDNAPCHNAKYTTNFLAKNGVEVLDWPPYSPDLNPIENVWSLIKREIIQSNSQILSQNDLIMVVKNLFFAIINDNILKNLSDSLTNRIEKVIENEGLWIE